MRPLKFLLLCATAALLAGCAGYHLGPVNGERAGEKSIEVLPFNSKTLQPRLGEAVTQALRENLQTDGTYRLATRGGGDIVVTGVIISYVRDSLSFLPGDVLTAENYHVTITAHVTAREPGTGKLLLDKNVSGSTLVQVGTDLASAERQSTPLLAEDLARNITELLTEGAW
ncbi:MAG TPA: LPS assembly lipoprotein LptE [Candidatus Paceibacterota bacterium]|nr:LPS assembly lipoprotein LptE [Candidatus Paceibacterota bacterium]